MQSSSKLCTRLWEVKGDQLDVWAWAGIRRCGGTTDHWPTLISWHHVCDPGPLSYSKQVPASDNAAPVFSSQHSLLFCPTTTRGVNKISLSLSQNAQKVPFNIITKGCLNLVSRHEIRTLVPKNPLLIKQKRAKFCCHLHQRQTAACMHVAGRGAGRWKVLLLMTGRYNLGLRRRWQSSHHKFHLLLVSCRHAPPLHTDKPRYRTAYNKLLLGSICWITNDISCVCFCLCR